MMEKGYRYRDFAVVSGDLTKQATTWKKVMEQLEVPFFMDYSEPLAQNPMAMVVERVLELFRTDFQYESVVAFLKTGFLEIPEEEETEEMPENIEEETKEEITEVTEAETEEETEKETEEDIEEAVEEAQKIEEE